MKHFIKLRELRKIIKAFILLLRVVSLRCRTPCTKFAVTEENVCGQHTDPPNRGVQFYTQTPISFLASQARGVLHHIVIFVGCAVRTTTVRFETSYVFDTVCIGAHSAPYTRRSGKGVVKLSSYFVWLLTSTLLNVTMAQGEIFIDVSLSAGITAKHEGSWDEFSGEDFTTGYLAMGQAWGDYDNDGWVDLYVTGGLAESVLYHNNQDGTFSVSKFSDDVSLPDAWTGGAVFADYDNDGWQDLYVLVHGANVLFRNKAGKGFRDVTEKAGVGDTGKGTTAAWGDYDNDGFLDLYVVNWSCFPDCDPVNHELASDRLYHNNGDGMFSDASTLLTHEKLLGAGFAASFADFDNDNDLDLYVVNDMLHNPIGNVLWRNDGAGCDGWCFTDISKETQTNILKHSMGIAVADYDNDLDLDIYFSDMVNPMTLLQNEAGVFTDVSEEAGVDVGPSSAVGWGTAFFDYNNDGWQDLYLATTEFIQLYKERPPEGMLLPYQNYFFENNGDGTFNDSSPQSWTKNPAPSMGMAYADYDRDGFVDFVVGNWNEGYVLYHNEGRVGEGNNWLTVELQGKDKVNRDAVGSRVYLRFSDGRELMQEVNIGSSLGAGNETALHFGLGKASVERATIVWSDGTKKEIDEAPINQLWKVVYGEEIPLFIKTNEEAGITAKHQGSWDMFSEEFKTGYLGIGQAWGDYDNDGWLDLYVTGNLTKSVLYHNNGDSTFSVSEFSESVSSSNVKTGGAVFADYDNDGYKDLYVLAHGANVLFHNEAGQGFTDVTADAGVGDTGKGSSATWGDYDEDGFLDLYVVNWACTPECAEPFDVELSSDRLYHNNGDGTFSDANHLLVHEKLLGAGFTASFVDFDNDSDLDIYVVNDSLKNPIGNVLWRNDGAGCEGWCWSDASKETGAGIIIEGMGLAVGDYDNDLDQDFYMSNMVNAAALLQNQNANFEELADEAGVEVGPSSAVGWGTVFFDYNNDGWQDLQLVATEFVQLFKERPPEGMLLPYQNFLFENNRDGSFRDATPQVWKDHPEPSMGVAYGDYDNDGWVDFVVGNFNQGYTLYRNNAVAEENNWLKVRLEGAGDVNRDAVGTKVFVTTFDELTQMQEVRIGSSLGAGNDTALHFGLGKSSVKEIKVIWPNDVIEVFHGVPKNQTWHVTYRDERQGKS